HLATSRIIFIDNYFGFIAGMPVTKKQIIIQLWHAAGAVKTFGFKDEQVKLRRQPARERFQFNYDQVDYTVVGSDRDRKSTRLNSSHVSISYAVFCLKKKIIIKQYTCYISY